MIIKNKDSFRNKSVPRSPSVQLKQLDANIDFHLAQIANLPLQAADTAKTVAATEDSVFGVLPADLALVRLLARLPKQKVKR